MSQARQVTEYPHPSVIGSSIYLLDVIQLDFNKWSGIYSPTVHKSRFSLSRIGNGFSQQGPSRGSTHLLPTV
ncbi:hypothetical protein M405DRAFT_804453, partial [Rhizopogon salebrosus TDB-379]